MLQGEKMIRKLVPSVILALLLVSGSAFADVFITPYGAFNFFNSLSTQNTLDVDPELDFFPPQSVELSQLKEAGSVGVTIGSRSENSGMVLALNVEYIQGSSNELFVVYDGNGQDYTIGEMKIDSPAIAVGGFIGAIVPGLSTDSYSSIAGLEVGALKPTGSITLKYRQSLPDPVNITTETHDFSETSLYVSFMYTGMYSFSDMFGVSGTLGWRSVDTKVETIDTAAMSGVYGQQYGGGFVRLGLDVEF
jgi:hypothetical protein